MARAAGGGEAQRREHAGRLAKALAQLDEGTREDFDERAGIMEFDGGMPRDQAEREAWRVVVQGKPARVSS